MSSDSFKVPQQKYYEREKFTTDEKFDILKKSGGVCCHCGKEIYAGYTMTVDHFIPLFKGGSNRKINLIPLCEDCNKTKDDKLYTMDYIKYIKPKYQKELSEYLESYVRVTDYVQRHRLLAYDEYDTEVIIPPRNMKIKVKNSKVCGVKSKYKIKLATWDDVDKLTEYLIKYLKKLNALDSKESARENIIFWMQFGCIYYIERDDDIKIMVAITIKHLSDSEDYRGINNQPYMYVFSYYNTEISINMVLNTIYDIPQHIREENNLPFIPINVLFLEKDKIKDTISRVLDSSLTQDNTSSFLAMHMIIGNSYQNDNNQSQSYEEMSDDEKKVYNFFKKFDDITENLIDYFKKYSSSENIGWMINSLISVSISKDTELAKYLNIVEYKSEE